jgi:hypothetical protein
MSAFADTVQAKQNYRQPALLDADRATVMLSLQIGGAENVQS